MGTCFVGRSEQLGQVRGWLAEHRPGPLLIVGEPGMGRTSLLRAALAGVDPAEQLVLELRPGDDGPFSALRHLLPEDWPSSAAVAHVAETIASRSGTRRLTVVVDDAHRTDHASMLTLRHLHRQLGASVLLTHADPAPDWLVDDPVDCLRYEHGVGTVRLPPLTCDEFGIVLTNLVGGPVRAATIDALHAATCGNPGMLGDIVVRQNIRARMVQENGLWRLDDSPQGSGAALTCRGTASLLGAVRTAWTALELGKVEDLCRLATWSGLAEDVAVIRATVSLLHDRPEHGLALLTEVPDRASSTHALVTAICLAFGADRLSEAVDTLATLATREPAERDVLLAYRTWLLATAGRVADAVPAQPSSSRRAALFTQTAAAIVALGRGHHSDAIRHLRRALVLAEADRADLPWMAPYLTAFLIDALLLAGRISEATSMAREFHGAAPSGDWGVAVAMAALTSRAARPNSLVNPEEDLGHVIR